MKYNARDYAKEYLIGYDSFNDIVLPDRERVREEESYHRFAGICEFYEERKNDLDKDHVWKFFTGKYQTLMTNYYAYLHRYEKGFQALKPNDIWDNWDEKAVLEDMKKTCDLANCDFSGVENIVKQGFLYVRKQIWDINHLVHGTLYFKYPFYINFHMGSCLHSTILKKWKNLAWYRIWIEHDNSEIVNELYEQDLGFMDEVMSLNEGNEKVAIIENEKVFPFRK